MITSITVLRAGALGDTVLALPALRALRTLYSPARLRVLGYPRWWEIGGSLVDEMVSIDDRLFATLYSDTPSNSLIDWLRDAELFVSWSARSVEGAVRAAGVSLVEATPYPPPGVHAAAWLLRTISAPVQSSETTWPWISPGGEEVSWAHAVLHELQVDQPVFIHPGAGAAWKRWPARSFARLGAALAARGHQILLVAGPADERAIAELLHCAPVPFRVIREPSARRLAALLSQGRLFVGNDSGVTHLAAAVGTPTIAIFGPTDPVSWKPLGRVRVVRGCTSRATLQGQIRLCDDPACLTRIPVEAVLAEATALLPGSCR
jgi:hypothetical protein